MTRDELIRTYRHPHWRGLALAYRLRRTYAVLAVTAVAALAAVFDLAPRPVAAVIAGVGGAHVVWVTGTALRVTRARTASWHASDSELDRVRRARPHAAESPVVHDEYAVSAEAGELVTWCFIPLDAHGVAVGGEVLIEGRPRYAASVVERTPKGRLDEAQALAAEWEAEAAREAA